MKWSSIRLGFRLARRELRRSPGRAALVIAMVFIPTCAMSAVATVNRATYRSPAARHAEVYGQATAQYAFESHLFPFSAGPLPVQADIEALTGRTGTSISVEHELFDRVRFGGRSVTVEVSDVNLANPVVDGRFARISGRPPTHGETTLSARVAKLLGVGVGDVVTFDRLRSHVRVVGVVDKTHGDIGGLAVVGDPVTIDAATHVYSRKPADMSLGLPSPAPTGWTNLTESYSGTDDTWQAWNLLGGAVGLFALGGVIAAAFTVGARRAVHTIGLLAASGASSGVTSWSLVAQGYIAGTIGSLLGASVGTVGVRLLPLSFLRDVTNTRAHAAWAQPLDLLPIIAVGVLAAVLAAVLPARAAARVSVLQALGARRPDPKVRRGSGFLAIVLAPFGALAAGRGLEEVRTHSYHDLKALLLATVGAVAVGTSVFLIAPLVVRAYERVFRGRSLAWRLAARSLTRNRTRSASVIAATCIVVGVIIGATSLNQSWATSSDSGFGSYGVPTAAPNQVVVASRYASDNPLGEQLRHATTPPRPRASIVARVRKIVPDAERIDPMWVGAEVTGPGYLLSRGSEDGLHTFGDTKGAAIATTELLDLFAVPASVRDRLGMGDAITINSPGNRSNFHRRRDIDHHEPVLHVIAQFRTAQSSLALPRVLVTQETADAAGWHPLQSGATVLVAPKRLNSTQVRRVQTIAADVRYNEQTHRHAPGEPYRADDVYVDTLHLATLGTASTAARVVGFSAASVFVLAVVGVALALSARDAQDESAVLDAIGAPPRERRRVGTRRAAILVGTASALGAPVALGTVAIIVALSQRENVALRVDWVALGLVALALPAVVAAASAVGGWLRDHMRPTQPDVFAFDD